MSKIKPINQDLIDRVSEPKAGFNQDLFVGRMASWDDTSEPKEPIFGQAGQDTKPKTYNAVWTQVKNPLYWVDCPHCGSTIFMGKPNLIAMLIKWATNHKKGTNRVD